MKEQNLPRKLSGDTIVPGKVSQWDTSITVRGSLEETWKWVSRIGLVEENGAGYLLPRTIELFLPARYHSLRSPDERDELPQLQKDDAITDGPNGNKAKVREVTDEGANQPKTLLFESRWPDTKKHKGWHYSWQLVVEKRPEGGETTVFARTRMANVRHPRIIPVLGPSLDWLGMNLIKKGLNERLSQKR